jgi:predicted component of type VI protein secretion system
MKENPTTTAQNVEVIKRLREIREELVRMKHQLDYVT